MVTDPFDDGPAIRIAETGPEARPDDGPAVAIAEYTHFRRIGEDRMALYHEGDHVPVGHRDAEAIPAELRDGIWVPVETARNTRSKADKR